MLGIQMKNNYQMSYQMYNNPMYSMYGYDPMSYQNFYQKQYYANPNVSPQGYYQAYGSGATPGFNQTLLDETNNFDNKKKNQDKA